MFVRDLIDAKKWCAGTYVRLLTPLGKIFKRIGIPPNALTAAGLVFSAVACIFYAKGSFFWGACVVVIAGICDTMDGEIARQTGNASRFGAFFDSTLDRFGEMLVLLGFVWYFTNNILSPWAVVLTVLALSGSFMVSYSRARAEGLGVDCKVGWMQRPGRILILVIGSLLGSIPVIGFWAIILTLFSLALLGNLTAVQRIIHVKKAMERAEIS